MSASVYALAREDRLTGVRYIAGHHYFYGSNDRHGIEVPPSVSVDFLKGSLVLDIADARDLLEELAVVLVEHAVALKDSHGPKAVA
ncbi:hypothetical protein [Nocardia sp. NPDC056000]|uniref:hypothetical protein n=1 Tax=Nocardia sp. NPDC056000 TaxID=3345674 RepID=UPI0035D9F372